MTARKLKIIKKKVLQVIVNVTKKLTPLKLRLFLRKINWRRMYYQKLLFTKTKSEVLCPISEKTFRLFPNDISITTGARCRHRLFWLYLIKETDIFNNKYKVLHSAPQYGIMKKLQSRTNLEYIPCDKFMPGYDYLPNVRNIDLLDIPFDNNYFDFIICNRVLEHIVEDIKAMEEMYRVLKPGGTALISVPLDYNLKETHESYTSRSDRIKFYGQWDHVRMYNPDIKSRLEKTGFQVDMNKYSDNFSEHDFKKFGLCQDTIFVCKK